MHSKKLLSLAVSLFMADSAVAGPCKVSSAASSIASTTLSESTTIILPVPSSTETESSALDTTQATSQAETSEAATTTLLTVTTKEETSTILVETSTAVSEATTIASQATSEADATSGAETTTAEATTTAETTAAETTTAETTTAETTTAETTTAEAGTTAESTTTEAGTTTGATTTEAGTTTEAATTTTEAETTTAEAGCPQNTVLANPTPIFVTDANNPYYDDAVRMITLPFPVGVFGTFSSDIYVSTNGIISLYDGTSHFANEELPSANVPDVSLFVYWDDLKITSNACNVGIFYDVYETNMGRAATIEWNVGANGNVEHFTATFFEDYLGTVIYKYFETSRKGESATVGMQNLLDGQLKFQYSFDSTNSIPNRRFLQIDTSSNGALSVTSAAF